MNVRLKTLKKIAQAPATTPAPPTATTPTTATPTVAPAGNPASVSLSIWPTVPLAWGTNNVSYLQKFLDTLNMTLFNLSNGKTDLDKMRQQNFNTDLSQYVAATKGVASLAKEFSQKVLTNGGQAFKQALTPEEKAGIIAGIRGSTTLGTIPDGSINSTLPGKIGGNFKTIILNLLNNIK
jgi:hypothetical protein